VLGEVSVVEKVVGFKKIKFFTHENAGYGDVRLPDIQMHTTSFWWTVPAAICLEQDLGRAAAIDGLRGILRALETIATIALMCDPRDIGQSLDDGILGAQQVPAADAGAHDQGVGFDPTLFLFDNVPGGIGLAARIHEQAEELFFRVRRLIGRCPCDVGCPQCVGAVETPTDPTAARQRGRKHAASMLLDRLVLNA
jgi:DEAD/DEAH box helicase domain-containing protein